MRNRALSPVLKRLLVLKEQVPAHAILCRVLMWVVVGD